MNEVSRAMLSHPKALQLTEDYFGSRITVEEFTDGMDKLREAITKILNEENPITNAGPTLLLG